MSKNKIDPKDNVANQKNGNNGTPNPNEQYRKARENTERQRNQANEKKSGN